MAETRVRSRHAHKGSAWSSAARSATSAARRTLGGSQRRRHRPTAAPGRRTVGHPSGDETLRSSAGGGRRLCRGARCAPSCACTETPTPPFTTLRTLASIPRWVFWGFLLRKVQRGAAERRARRRPACCRGPGCYGAAGKHPTCCCRQPQKRRAHSSRILYFLLVSLPPAFKLS